MARATSAPSMATRRRPCATPKSRLSPIAEELLADIDQNTVDFEPNYDGRHEQPSILPARVPNLLLNGSSGIAVGMATNIPPHNLNELADAISSLLISRAHRSMTSSTS